MTSGKYVWPRGSREGPDELDHSRTQRWAQIPSFRQIPSIRLDFKVGSDDFRPLVLLSAVHINWCCKCFIKKKKDVYNVLVRTISFLNWKLFKDDITWKKYRGLFPPYIPLVLYKFTLRIKMHSLTPCKFWQVMLACIKRVWLFPCSHYFLIMIIIFALSLENTHQHHVWRVAIGGR